MKDADLVPTVPASPAAAERVGQRLGRYEVVGRVGAGGMGEVFAARDPELDRKVAVKVLHGAGTAAGRDRLRREAQAMARLAHPNVIVVHDVGVSDDRLFVAMELIDGQTLRAWQRGGARGWREVVAKMVAAGRGLAAAHRAGVVHRDFKADNVLLGSDGRVVVSDFGLARVGDRQDDEAPAESFAPDGPASATVTGTIAGTPAYMAPEQHLGKRVGPAADQFSFCATLYEALWGQTPFVVGGEGVESAIAVGMEIVAGRVREPPGAGVPGWLRRAVLRGLKVDPDERHGSMAELVGLLERGLGRRRRMVAAAAGAAVIGGAVVVLLLRGGGGGATPRCRDLDRPVTEAWRARRGEVMAAVDRGGAGKGGPVAQAMDARADAWVSAREAACAEGEQGVISPALLDLRMRCLDRRLVEMRALADALRDVDAAAAARARDAVDALPDVGLCADDERLAKAVPPPEDPAIRAHADALQGRRAAVAAAMALGRYRSVVTEAQALAREAGAIPAPATQAEVLRTLGDVHAALGAWEPARVAYQAAAAHAADAHDDREEALAWTGLIDALLGLGRPAEAATLLAPAEAAVRRAGSPPRLRHGLTMVTSAVHMAQGHLDDARAVLQRASVDAPDDDARALAQHNLGNVEYEAGRLEDARAAYERARDLFTRSKGADHVDVADALQGLGRVAAGLGDADAAQAAFARALAIHERDLGGDSETVAGLHQSLGNLALDRGELDAADDHYRKALAIAERADNRLQLAGLHSGIANVDGAAGRSVEAAAHLDRALALYDATVGREHRDYAMAEYNLASVEIADGRCDRARPRLAHAAQVLWDGDEPLRLAFVQSGLGECAVHDGRGAEAKAEFERLLTLCREVDCPPILTAVGRYGVAQSTWLAGDRARALKLLAASRAELVGFGPGAAPQVAQLDAWLRAQRIRLPR